MRLWTLTTTMLATPLLRTKELPNLQYISAPDRFDDSWVPHSLPC
jgi:hypothetical protein